MSDRQNPSRLHHRCPSIRVLDIASFPNRTCLAKGHGSLITEVAYRDLYMTHEQSQTDSDWM